MRAVQLNLCFLAFLLSAGPAITYAQQKAVFVSGRAVDERGVPVSDAIVTLYTPPCHNCIDHVLPVTFSLPDGVFFIDSATISTRELKLYIRERVPKGFWSPLEDPPFENLSYLPQFKGIPIRPRKGRLRVDMGDVLVGIRYSRVMVELSKILGEQYKPSQEAAKLLRLTLRDKRKKVIKVIYDGSLPEGAFNHTFSSLNLALTKGQWILEFHLNDQNLRTESRRIFVETSSSGCTKVTLRDSKQYNQRCN